MAKHDWPTIRREYVEGFDKDGRIHRPSLREIAARHGVDATMVRHRARAEGWSKARHNFDSKAAQARETARVRVLAAEGAAFDRRMLRVAGGLVDLVERAREAVAATDDAIDHLELARLCQAARHAQVIAKIALGEAPGGDDLPALPGSGALAATVRVIYDRQPLPGAVSEG